MPAKTVVVHSGGLDSTTLLYHLLANGHDVKTLTIDYRQRHLKEAEAARQICKRLGIEHRLVELPQLVQVFGANALTDSTAVLPEGAYSEETISRTTVPNRNMIFLSIAIGWAASLQFDGVAFGAHAGEFTNYPDCQPEFAAAMNAAAAVSHTRPIAVHSPFITWNKTQIVQRGVELGVPFEQTWSCYSGGELHCGRCSTCHDRRQAFANAGVKDPVSYEV